MAMVKLNLKVKYPKALAASFGLAILFVVLILVVRYYFPPQLDYYPTNSSMPFWLR
jgi:hypothetical protein